MVISTAGIRWRRAGAPICVQPHGLRWSLAEGAWYVLGDDGFGGPPVILRNVGEGAREVMYRLATDVAGGSSEPGSWVEWQATDLLVADSELVAIGEVGLFAEDGRGTSTMWSLTSRDGRSWELSMGWPAMVGQRPVDYPTVAAAVDGTLVVVALDQGGAVWADVSTVQPFDPSGSAGIHSPGSSRTGRVQTGFD